MDTADERDERRSSIEEVFNGERVKLSSKYLADREALEVEYQNALKANQKAKEEAFAEAGLNPDGSVAPPARETEVPEYGKQKRAVVN